MTPKHNWHSWDNYQAVHASRLQDFSHFILEDALTATMTPTGVMWQGLFHCVDGLEIHVTKRQEVRDRGGQPEVRTVEYSYHLLRKTNDEATNLFRYDNIHPQPGDPDRHHRHRFDVHGDEVKPPTHVGTEGWPNLGEVIDEAHKWWERHRADRGQETSSMPSSSGSKPSERSKPPEGPFSAALKRKKPYQPPGLPKLPLIPKLVRNWRDPKGA